MGANVDKVKGRVEQAVGDLTGDKELKDRGETDEAVGDLKEAVHGIEDTATDLIDKVKDTMENVVGTSDELIEKAKGAAQHT
jgi:uncharacterized protein YjbJ (UPF0337 family)